MGQKVEVGGTGRDLKGGKALIGGTAYAVKKGRMLKDGTGYDVSFLKKVFHITYSIVDGYYNANRIIYNGEYLEGNGELYLEEGESIDLYTGKSLGYQGSCFIIVNLNGTQVYRGSTQASEAVTYRFTPTSDCEIIGKNVDSLEAATWYITTQ